MYEENNFSRFWRCTEYWVQPELAYVSWDKYEAFFDPETVAELKRIVEETNADIVIESSWKYLGLEAMQQMWSDRNMPGKVIDVTPSSATDNMLLNANRD